MAIDRIRESLEPQLQEVNSIIKDALVSEVELIDSINSYLYAAKGKQLRMMLSLLSAKTCGKIEEQTLICAAVVEMIHTATLLHDDVADNSPERRGHRTVQSIYSPASSVLMGDYWLSKAVLLLLSCKDFQMMEFFSRAVQDLSEGELLQIQKADSLDTTQEDYLNIIGKKTSSLFIAAVAGGAHSAGASHAEVKALERYAYYLGAAFQIRDDILDYSPQFDTGKQAGSDIKERKLTLPLLSAFESAPKNEVNHFLNTLLNSSTNESELLVEQAFHFVQKYRGVEKAQKLLFDYSKEAIDSLSHLKESTHKEDLKQIARFVENRVL